MTGGVGDERHAAAVRAVCTRKLGLRGVATAGCGESVDAPWSRATSREHAGKGARGRLGWSGRAAGRERASMVGEAQCAGAGRIWGQVS